MLGVIANLMRRLIPFDHHNILSAGQAGIPSPLRGRSCFYPIRWLSGAGIQTLNAVAELGQGLLKPHCFWP